ncbi:MAG: septal ring lytic transglycosylase RlpA family protein [Gammaproteobacteria bacterium]|nr:septal ring lytic transglycosylase RlpA family protein [Gammaproteobacteria bacterium]MBU1653287.1 septal ring lytic transglycosylase RlpA family protein [Gammaproteobacteria bacterium]MBU1961513.1 septal ring lytic transglycosylase RlpA family protein [Gammaproteobacteria bacterium]
MPPTNIPSNTGLGNLARAGLLLALSSLLSGCLGFLNPFGSSDSDKPRSSGKGSRGNPPVYEVFGQRYYTMTSTKDYVERGIASWYGGEFNGRNTSSGEVYDMHLMTAAHTRLPIPCYAQVTNLENGRTTVVRINDRGPFKKNRLIDLSYAAARELDILGKGTGLVEVRALPAKEAPRPVAPLDPAKGDIYIQVGAFGNQDNASLLKDRLASSLQQPVRIAQSVQNGQALFRVQVGPLQDVEMTDRLAVRIAALGMGTYIVID